jgi:succinate-semialdehyde dehydrogenase/glutarate-semialdehyde dehydrogenase
MIKAINPASGQTIRTYEESSATDVERSVQRAQAAFAAWRRVAVAERAVPMRAAVRRLRERKEEFARLMAMEMGKPVTQGRAETEKCALACEFYAEHAAAFLAPEPVRTDARRSFVAFEPLGVVLAVMPWNFPFWQVFRAAAPALMAGNAIILKHASNVPGCALAIAEVFREAGFPEGLFEVVLVSAQRVNGLIEHPHIRGVTLTGSTPAGSAVAAHAGARLKKTVLELGGSDPYLVLEDAELEPTAETCATARLLNSGQSCIAAKRFLVVRAVRDQFEKLLVERMRSRIMGDPLDDQTALGPLARHDLREQLHRQVEQTIRRGARCLLGGQIPEGPGAFYPATVLTGVSKGMPAYDEETFGPVAAVIGVKDEAEAVAVANDSQFGLGAAVFTRDAARGERIATRELEAGCCFVNDFVRSDPRLPFGGVKQSGYGRELGMFGIREFANIKSVVVK